MKKMKVLALVLAAIMVLALLPAISFAGTVDYYLVGKIHGTEDWFNLNGDYKFTANGDGTYTLRVQLSQYDAFKVVGVNSDNPDRKDWTWYPDGENYNVPNEQGHFGYNTITFRTEHKVEEGWHGGYFKVDGMPTVEGHSLTLNGEIGVNFYVCPGNWYLYRSDYDRARMVFTIKDNTGAVVSVQEYDTWTGFIENVNGVECFGYTCKINVTQMAQTIEARLWMGGEDPIASENYKAEDYFKLMLDNGWLDADNTTFKNDAKNMIIATWNYCYYLQDFLIANNNLGNKYNKMTDLTAQMPNYVLELKADENQIPNTGIVKTQGWTELFDNTQYSLVLESKTTLKVFMTPKSGTPSLKLDNVDATYTTSGSEWIVKIENIPAHQLCDVHILKADGNDSATATFSALHYAGSMLNHSNDTLWTNAANALANYAFYARAYYNHNMYTNYTDYNNNN